MITNLHRSALDVQTENVRDYLKKHGRITYAEIGARFYVELPQARTIARETFKKYMNEITVTRNGLAYIPAE